MSAAEIDRFQIDMKSNDALAREVRTNGLGLEAIVITAESHGYSFNLEQLKEYITSKSEGSLTDEQLAGVAAAGSTWSIQNTAGVTELVVVAVAVIIGVIVVT